MWNVKRGRLYWGSELVAVRRVIVQMVMGRERTPPTEERVRHMVRMERALSLQDLSHSLAGIQIGR